MVGWVLPEIRTSFIVDLFDTFCIRKIWCQSQVANPCCLAILQGHVGADGRGGCQLTTCGSTGGFTMRQGGC